jgi:hypothetical protein
VSHGAKSAPPGDDLDTRKPMISIAGMSSTNPTAATTKSNALFIKPAAGLRGRPRSRPPRAA